MTESEYKTVVKLMIEKLEQCRDEIAEKDAEIEWLTICRKEEVEKLVEATDKVISEAKVEAINAFVKRLKEKYGQADILCPRKVVSLTVIDLDNLVKEMVGDKE